jgi:nucleotide-binding universal stress UspA family protein
MNILVGYDGSRESKKALKLAQKRAKVMGAKIVVVYAIVRFDSTMNHEAKKAEQVLQCEVHEMLIDGRIPYETRLLSGTQNRGDQVAEFAETHNIAEIIIGAPKRSGIGKPALGSTVRQIVLNAPCPVITVN